MISSLEDLGSSEEPGRRRAAKVPPSSPPSPLDSANHFEVVVTAGRVKINALNDEVELTPEEVINMAAWILVFMDPGMKKCRRVMKEIWWK
jgi:hypothetical protein